jgi:hypothetical protein
MDILDIILGKKAATGDAAPLMSQARQAIHDAEVATNNVNAVLETATAANTAAQTASETATAAVTRANTAANTYDNLLAVTDNSMIADFSDAITNAINTKSAAIDGQLQNAITAAGNAVTDTIIEDNNTSSYKGKRVKVRKNNTDTTYDITKNYTTTGQNEDGSMTQKAITNALATQKIDLETQINNIQISGSSSGSGNVSGNFSSADQGSLVVVGENGNLTASTTSEESLIKSEILLGTYEAINAVGVEIDYDNKTVERIQSAIGLNAGQDFNAYPMFGGRRRCIVNDDGEIVAFYGDQNYIEDGSIGQVMVYQPKFYYLKMPLKVTKTNNNRILINKEVLLVSNIKQAGFKLHPLFIDANGYEIDYALLSAYEGCAYNSTLNTYNTTDSQNVSFNIDKLSSIANAKPISGTTQAFTVSAAETLAANRGTGWKLTNLAAESVNQMLMVIEYGSLNLQSAFYLGIVNTPDYSTLNSSSLTGSTSNLGSTSGMAASSTQTHNGISETFDVNGKCAISYRGFENPYGNIWRFVGETKLSNNYLTINNTIFNSAVPETSSWISHFGYDADMPWAFIPTECSNANSAVPVGDFTYVNTSTSNDKCCVVGGKNSSAEYAGPFYYGIDYAYDFYARTYSARIMYIPNIADPIYLANITKWENEVGGD